MLASTEDDGEFHYAWSTGITNEHFVVSGLDDDNGRLLAPSALDTKHNEQPSQSYERMHWNAVERNYAYTKIKVDREVDVRIMRGAMSSF